MYIEQPSLSLGSFVYITTCYACLDPIALTMQRYIYHRRDIFCEHQAHRSDYSVPSFCRCFCSIALYGLVLFYCLTKEELAGAHPLAKFLSVKLIVIFTFYQSFVVSSTFFLPPFSRLVVALVLVKFNALKGRVIHVTQFWTSTNVADGLNALTICIEA